MPGGTRKAPTRYQQHYVSRESIEWMASTAIRRTRYRGTDDEIFWKAAALVSLGKLAEAQFWDSVDGTIACRASNPPAYFRRCLQEHAERDGMDLRQALAEVRLT